MMINFFLFSFRVFSAASALQPEYGATPLLRILRGAKCTKGFWKPIETILKKRNFIKNGPAASDAADPDPSSDSEDVNKQFAGGAAASSGENKQESQVDDPEEGKSSFPDEATIKKDLPSGWTYLFWRGSSKKEQEDEQVDASPSTPEKMAGAADGSYEAYYKRAEPETTPEVPTRLGTERLCPSESNVRDDETSELLQKADSAETRARNAPEGELFQGSLRDYPNI